MAVTKISIVNAALVLVGAKKISSLTDNSKSARLASDLYEVNLKNVFGLPHNWKFATTRRTLSEYGTEPISGYDKQYLIPEDSQRIIAMVEEDDDEIQFKWRREFVRDTSVTPAREYDVVLTNEETVRIKYVALREDPARYPGWFVKLLYTSLAVMLSQPLKQSKQDREQLRSMEVFALNDALAGDSAEDADSNEANERLDDGSTEVVDAASNGIAGRRRYVWERR